MSVDVSDMLELNQKKELEIEETQALIEAVTSSELERVTIDGLAVLKILQHAERSDTKNSSGFLLGTDFDSELQITDSFIYNEETYTGENFDELVRHLSEINCDNRQIGWYQIMDSNSSYLSSSIIQDQLAFQKETPRSTLIVYDPYKTLAERRLYLKAYRLTKDFLKLFKGDDFSKEPIPISQKYDEILDVVPISITNSETVSCYLRLYAKPNELDYNLNYLFESSSSATQLDLNYLMDSTTHLLAQQERFMKYKRAIKNRIKQNADISNYTFPVQQDFLLALDRTETVANELKENTFEDQAQNDILFHANDETIESKEPAKNKVSKKGQQKKKNKKN